MSVRTASNTGCGCDAARKHRHGAVHNGGLHPLAQGLGERSDVSGGVGVAVADPYRDVQDEVVTIHIRPPQGKGPLICVPGPLLDLVPGVVIGPAAPAEDDEGISGGRCPCGAVLVQRNCAQDGLVQLLTHLKGQRGDGADS